MRAYVPVMSKLPIITAPDPILREKSLPVERVDAELHRLLDDMLETMYAAPGIGLAAIQVGIPRRVLVADIAKDDEPRAPLFLINPKIVAFGEEMALHEEGCLSVPEHYAEIERPASCRVTYLDRDGQRQETTFDGLMARVIQHEIDHLDGKLFIDYLSRLKRDRVIKKLVKARREAAA